MMTNLRKKRLLLLATAPKWHKRFYSQYCVLMRDGFVKWCLGTAFLTEEGKKELDILMRVSYKGITEPCQGSEDGSFPSTRSKL
jgi:hypothetical protein